MCHLLNRNFLELDTSCEIEYFSIEYRETEKLSQQPIGREENTLNSQWELEVKPTKLPKVRENAGNQAVIGFSFGGEFLDQSQSSPGLLSTFDWKLLPRHNRGRSVFFFPHVHVLLVLLCQVYMFALDQQNALLVPFALIPSWSQCESCHSSTWKTLTHRVSLNSQSEQIV